MAKVSDDRKRQWRENRAALIKAGFAGPDATRLSKSNANTKAALATGQAPAKNESKAKAGKKGGEIRREKSGKPPRPAAQPKQAKSKAPRAPVEPKIPQENRKAAPRKAANPGTARFNSTINRWYTEVSQTEKYYYSAFTYIVEFKRRDGSTDYISITSPEMLTAWQVINEARAILFETYFLPTPANTPKKNRQNGSDPSKAKPLMSSLRVVKRIYNRDEHLNNYLGR